MESKQLDTSTNKMNPSLSNIEVMERFSARATVEEIRRFEEMRTASDSDTLHRAMQMVLFKLTSAELTGIGVTQVQLPDRHIWCVAFSSDSEQVRQAVHTALDPVGVGAGESCSRGYAGWYVNREQFFTARRALLEAAGLRELGVVVVEPRFAMP
jgi:hypothetical protein